MEISTGVASRWSRAAILTLVAGGTGVIAHAASGGFLPQAGQVIALFGVGVAISALALGRPATRRRVITLVIAGQTAMHLVLTAMTGHRGDPLPVATATANLPTPPLGIDAGPSLISQYQYTVATLGPDAAAPPAWVQHLAADLSGSNAVMALAHLTAAAVIGWWLASGETALWTVLALLAGGLGVLLARWRPQPHEAPAAVRAEHDPTPRAMLSDLSRRGPPPRVLALALG